MDSKFSTSNPILRPILKLIHDQLELNGLGVESIEKQLSENLKESLNLVNRYIDYPLSLEMFDIKHSRSKGFYFSHSGLTLSFEAVILPILLNRRSLIMGRLESLKLDDSIQSLSESIKGIGDKRHLLQLTDKIQGLRINSQALRQRLVESSKEQEKIHIQMERERLAIFEGKFKMFLALLEKEAAATLIGVVFIAITSLILVAVTFTSPDQGALPILKDCLFLVFGYFFGQATTHSSH